MAAVSAAVKKEQEAILFKEFRASTVQNIDDQQKLTVDVELEKRFKKPTFENLPRLLKNDVDKFYEGEYTQWREYEPLPEFTRLEKKVYGNNELTTIYELLEGARVLAESSKGRSEGFLHVAVVGPAGSGKTTLIRRFARDAVKGEYKQLQDEDRIIHIVDCRSFNKDKEMSISDFLFASMSNRPSKEAMAFGYQWMLQNSEKILILVDSLDTLPYELDNEFRTIEPHEQSLPATILYNIFIGQVFPKARIVSSSREFKIRNYKDDLRPDKIISLGGLEEESIRNLTFGYLDELEAERIWLVLTKQSPDLLALCENPLFLVLTLIGLCTDELSSFLPNNVTGVLEKVLESLIHSEYARALGQGSEDYIITAINKMKKLSIRGTEQQRVLFSAEDLSDVNLTTNEMTDLVIVGPGRLQELRRQQLLEGECISMFAHQCFQEFLSACEVAEMILEDFKKFVAKSLHDPHYSVVRRMLNGLIANWIVFQHASRFLLRVNANINDLRSVLSASMKKELDRLLHKGYQDGDLVEIVRAIHEAGDGAKDIVPSHVDEIIFKNVPLLTADFFAVASCIAYCATLDVLRFSGCNMTKESLEMLLEKLATSSIKVHLLYFGSVKGLDEDSMRKIAEFVKHHDVQGLCLVDCGLKLGLIKALDQSLGEKTLSTFDVENNKGFGAEELACVGEFVQKRRVEELGLTACSMTLETLRALHRSLGDAKLHTLRMSFNSKLSVDGFALLGKLVETRGVRLLSVEGCKLSREDIRTLDASLGSAKLHFLDVSSNVLPPEGMAALGRVIRTHAIARVAALGLNLNGELLHSLCQNLGDAKMELLDVSNNEGIGVEGMQRLGEVARTTQLKILAIRGSRIEADEGRAFNESVGNHKLETLQLSKEVCYEKAGHLVSNAPPEIDAAVEMLPVVAKYVEFNGYELNSSQRRALQNKLDELGNSELTIVVGGKRLHGSNKWTRAKILKERKGTVVASELGAKGKETKPAATAETPEYTLAVREKIGRTGGQVRVGDYSIHFPAGAFTEDSDIFTATYIGKFEESDEVFSVSPTLHCTSSKEMHKAAKTKIPIWVSTDEHDQRSRIKVRRKREGENQNWEVLKSIPLHRVQQGFVELECKEFSWYDVVMDLIHGMNGPVRFHATGSLFYDPGGNFSFGLHVDNETARAKCVREFEATHALPVPNIIEQFVVSELDPVRFGMNCETQGREFNPLEKGFKIGRDFLNGRRFHFFRSLLYPPPEPGVEVILRHEFRHLDDVQNGRFQVVWPERQVQDVHAKIFIADGAEIHGNVYVENFIIGGDGVYINME